MSPRTGTEQPASTGGSERSNASACCASLAAPLSEHDAAELATLLSALAEGVAPLLGPDTGVVFAQNGIPWWYGTGLAKSRPAAPDLSRLDPGGALARAIGYERTLGGAITGGRKSQSARA